MHVKHPVFAVLGLIAGLMTTAGSRPAAAMPPVTNGLALAFDGRDVTSDPAGRVQSWNNQAPGGAAFTARQAEPRRQPRLDAERLLNGHRVLLFDGADDPAEGDELVVDGFRPAGEATVFVVARRDPQTPGGSFLRPFLTAGYVESTLALSAATEGKPTTLRLDYAGASATFTLPRLDDDDFQILCAVAATGTLRTALYANGLRGASLSVQQAPRKFGDVVIGGQKDASTRHFHGAIAEVLFYDRALSDEERREVERHLGDKYQLDTLPPPRPVPGTLHVAINHPHASDRNPGTRDLPFKTLRRAADMAMAGDRILVGAGVYREPLTTRASGNSHGASDGTRIRFEADGQAAVILDGSEPVAPAAWQPVAGQSRVYVADLNAALRPGWHDPGSAPIRYVFVDGRSLPPCRVPAPEAGKGLVYRPPEDADVNTWFYDAGAARLYVNLAGADPRQGLLVEAAVRDNGINLRTKRLVTVSGFTVRRVNGSGIDAGDSLDISVTDCAVEYAHQSGITISGARGALVRRCYIRHIGGIGVHSNGARDVEISENTVFSWYENAHGLHDGYNKVGYTVFGGRFNQYFHNIAVMPANWTFKGGGFWTDCAGLGHVYMGNATRNTWNSGFYIESPADNNLVRFNTVTAFRNQGIYLRSNRNNLVAENYVADGGTALVLSSTEHATVANNLFSHNWVKNVGTPIGVGRQSADEAVQTRNDFNRNVYDVSTNLAVFAQWAGVAYASLDAFRQATGQEAHGRLARINPDELGMVYVRVDEPGIAHDPIPMLANPYFERAGSRPFGGVYFWLRGDGDGSDSFPEWPRPGANFPFKHEGFSDQRARKTGGVQTCGNRWARVVDVPGTPVGGTCFQAYALTDQAADARGAGVWTPILPVAGGAEIELAFWLRSDDVRPVTNDGGVVVYFEWSNRTGQNTSRSYVVGGEDNAMTRPELNRGTFGWTNVQAVVRAPADARRFGLYFGLRSAHGAMSVDAVETLRQQPGARPDDAAALQAGPPPSPLAPESLDFTLIDLSGIVNRTLADEVANDGAGGWTDQGAGYDLKGLPTGRRTQDGTPFELLAPRTCVMLRSTRLAAGGLPDRVSIPVGARANLLSFLHSGAGVAPGATQWSYVVRYDDGSEATIPVVGGVHVRDWSAAGDTTAFPATPGLRVTVWPDKVGNIISPECGLYRMDWLNPHPDRVIEAIDMIAEKDSGVPILFAITLGAKR